MGVVASGTPRPVVHTPLQLFFRKLVPGRNVAYTANHDMLRFWFGHGAPLALTLETFTQLVGLQSGSQEAKQYFEAFDTDLNQKVDALEVLPVAIILGSGTLQDKLESLFTIFDFSTAGRLNYDEVSILLTSLTTGYHKVLGAPLFEEDDIDLACKLLYDGHNIAYERHVSKEQIKRFLQLDDEGKDYINSIHKAVVMEETLEMIGAWEEEELQEWRLIAGQAGGSIEIGAMKQSAKLVKSLRSQNEDALECLWEVLVKAPSTLVAYERFVEAVRAWNAFLTVCDEETSTVKSADVPVLLWLWKRQEPSTSLVDSIREKMELADVAEEGGKHKAELSEWLSAAL